MTITIHRGIDQIGGCITEIATARTRILIDLGQNLPDGEGVSCDELATHEAVENLTQGVGAIFYTHYHGDHIGLFEFVPEGVPQYMGEVASQVEIRKHRQLSFLPDRKEQEERAIAKLEKMHKLIAECTVTVGDIRVTPYFVSHSAYLSFMFLVEADGRRVLHTGDFRGHGYLSKGLLPTIQKLVIPQGKVDFLITEGTMLSRLDERVMSERVLQEEAAKIMTRYKNVFVMCSSTDMERLASFRAANTTAGRPLLVDSYQKNILKIFSDSAGRHSPLFDFSNVYGIERRSAKLQSWMDDKGFCMFVRATDKFTDYYRVLESRLAPDETVLIYSMWKEYINPVGRHANSRYLDFVSMFPNVEKLHTSGHVSAGFLADVCNLVDPTFGIIPIHSEDSASYANLPIGEHLRRRIITSSTIVGGVNIVINQKIVS